MKKLAKISALILTCLPSLSLAHGGHAPVPEPAHGLNHAAPALGLAVIALALGALLWQRTRS